MATAFDSSGKESVHVGRRVFLGLATLGALGVAFGNSVQNFFGNAFGSGLGGLLPGGDRFRIYSITGHNPQISPEKYRLRVSGLVDHPTTFTLGDLKSMPKTSFTKTFQCVTGWRVPDVHWEGVKLSDILERVGVQPGAVAISFDSYDDADTESLTLDQAHLPDVIVAYSMLGAPVTTAARRPGPSLRRPDVRLQVAQVAFGHSRRRRSRTWLLGAERLSGQWMARRHDGTDNPDPGLT